MNTFSSPLQALTAYANQKPNLEFTNYGDAAAG
jgi:hypothetical protein